MEYTNTTTAEAQRLKENETGRFFERDYSKEAESLFNAAVPHELVDYRELTQLN